MVERQDPDNIPSSTDAGMVRCALELSTYVFNSLHADFFFKIFFFENFFQKYHQGVKLLRSRSGPMLNWS